MYQKLDYEGTWRDFIKSGREGNFTDNLYLEELGYLLNNEKKHGELTNTGIEVAYFEYASPDEPSKEIFEAIQSEDLQKIKSKLDANDDFTALMVVYVDTHEKAAPEFSDVPEDKTKCEICNKESVVNKKTPCCKKALYCEACWATRIANENTCPLDKKGCGKLAPGDLGEVLMKPANKIIPRVGHYVALVLTKVGNKRHYFLMDSACETARFVKNRPIAKLLEFLEGNNAPIEILPRYIPEIPEDLANTDRAYFESLTSLKETVSTYKASYSNKPQQQGASAKKDDPFSFERKSFFGEYRRYRLIYSPPFLGTVPPTTAAR